MALIAWGGGWLWMKARIEHSLDLTANQLKAGGGTLGWSRRRIGGYPFRFDVDFINIAWRGPDGWGLQAPEMKSESSVFAFGHWVAFAPAGISLLRPTGGRVDIGARVFRASVSGMDSHPPTFSLEGQGMTFAPAPNAAPFPLSSLEELHLHTRAGPSDLGAAYVELEGARSFSGGAPASATLNLIYDHAAALTGQDWSAAHQAWSAAGGKVEIRQFQVRPGAPQGGSQTVDRHFDQFMSDSGGQVSGLIAGALLTALGAPSHRPEP